MTQDEEITLTKGVWIKKPAAGRGGQEVEIKSAPVTFAASPDHEVQAYITNPFLIRGKKFHVRMHFAISNMIADEIYLFRDGIVRIAPEDFF